ncbi:hypothetical protein TYRP_007025 [Tyrophagus putrescentiae]|nr:hypothetical protein TYRP_007025 [Tyrophagus putrescentiae]
MGFEFAVPAPPPPLPLPENASTKLVNRRLLTRLGLNDYLERSVPNLPKTAAKFSSETQVNSRLQALRSILAVVTGHRVGTLSLRGWPLRCRLRQLRS